MKRLEKKELRKAFFDIFCKALQHLCFDLDAVLPRPNSISKSVLWEQAPMHAEFFTKVRPPCQSRFVFFRLHENAGLCVV